jgi:hypothetical protein
MHCHAFTLRNVTSGTDCSQTNWVRMVIVPHVVRLQELKQRGKIVDQCRE